MKALKEHYSKNKGFTKAEMIKQVAMQFPELYGEYNKDQENKNKLTPNPAKENATQRPSPLTPVLEASVNAPSNAPTPVAPIRIPKPRAPPCKILSANIGISTV